MASRFGGVLSTISPVSATRPSGNTMRHDEPLCQSDSQCMPNQYCRMKSALVSADQSLSADVRIYVTYTNVLLSIVALQTSRCIAALTRSRRAWMRRRMSAGGFAFVRPFEFLLEFRQRRETRLLELADPALGDLIDRH